MTRARMRYTLTDADGNAIQNASAILFLADGTTPVSDAWNAEEGGSLIASVLSDARGRFEAWFDARKRITLLITDNGETAYRVDDPSRLVSFADFTDIVDAFPPPDEMALEDATGMHASSHMAGGVDPIALDELEAPTDTTDLNVSTTAHGLTPKLPDDSTKFLNGVGGWTTPPGTGGGGGGGGAPTDALYLVTTAHAGLTDEVVVGPTPGGELGGTWAAPTVDASHGGSAHDDFIAKAIVDAKGDLIVATGADTPARLAVGADGKPLVAASGEAAGLKYEFQSEDIPFSYPGALIVKVGTGRWLFREAVTVLGVRMAINTAPTGAALIADVNKNGSTIFTTQANRPTIAAGANRTTSEPTPDVTAFAANDEMRVDIDQVGSTVAGSDLTVIVRVRRT